MHWWKPELLYSDFLGTDGELVQVQLPPATQECLDNRVAPSDGCMGEDLVSRVGESWKGSCEEENSPLLKVVSAGLYRQTYNPNIQEANRSPGYDAVKNFRISSIQLESIFQFWRHFRDEAAANGDSDIPAGLTPRDAVCQFVVENLDLLRDTVIPQTYPRVVVDKDPWKVVNYVALGCAALAMISVMVTGLVVYKQRERPVIRISQIEFMLLIVSGIFLVSTAALLMSFPPSAGSCALVPWLVNMGYAMEFVPLIVKISAIHSLMMQVKKMSRKPVQITRKKLFGAVFGLSSLVVLYLILWSVLDRQKRQIEYALTAETASSQGDGETGGSETIVTADYYCTSNSNAWSLVSLGTLSLLLICASLLAYQTRNHRKDMNESKQLALLVYSKCFFIFLRLGLFFLVSSGSLSAATAEDWSSLIFSIDVMATIPIYFLPKLMTSDEEFDELRRTATMVDPAKSSVHFAGQQSNSNESSGGSGAAAQKTASKSGMSGSLFTSGSSEQAPRSPFSQRRSLNLDLNSGNNVLAKIAQSGKRLWNSTIVDDDDDPNYLNEYHRGKRNSEKEVTFDTNVSTSMYDNNNEIVPLLVVCKECGAEQTVVPSAAKTTSEGNIVQQKTTVLPDELLLSSLSEAEQAPKRDSQNKHDSEIDGSDIDDDDVDDGEYASGGGAQSDLGIIQPAAIVKTSKYEASSEDESQRHSMSLRDDADDFAHKADPHEFSASQLIDSDNHINSSSNNDSGAVDAAMIEAIRIERRDRALAALARSREERKSETSSITGPSGMTDPNIPNMGDAGRSPIGMGSQSAHQRQPTSILRNKRRDRPNSAASDGYDMNRNVVANNNNNGRQSGGAPKGILKKQAWW